MYMDKCHKRLDNIIMVNVPEAAETIILLFSIHVQNNIGNRIKQYVINYNLDIHIMSEYKINYKQ